MGECGRNWLLALAANALFAAAAHAGQSEARPGAPSGDAAQIGAPTGATAAEIAASAKEVTARLKLDSRQQAAFLAFNSVMASPPQTLVLTSDAYRAMNLPQRLDYMADHGAEGVARIRAAAAAAHRLYELLTPQQRAAFEEIMSPTPGGLAPEPTSAAAPATQNPNASSYAPPSWRVKPTEAQISRVYPSAAQRNHVSGRAEMTCRVDTDGYLADCMVGQESPEGQGFGNAALEVSAYMQMNPATAFGVPVESTVTVPIAFQPET